MKDQKNVTKDGKFNSDGMKGFLAMKENLFIKLKITSVLQMLDSHKREYAFLDNSEFSEKLKSYKMYTVSFLAWSYLKYLFALAWILF